MKKTLIMIFTVFVLGITAFAVFASGNTAATESTTADETVSVVEASTTEAAASEEVSSEIISESASVAVTEETVNTSVCTNRYSESCPYHEECSSECERADTEEHSYCYKNCEYGCKAVSESADSEYCEPHTYQQSHHKESSHHNRQSHKHHGR